MIFSGRGVVAVLGPTNTGKTHYAIERMVAHKSGVIGLPLRLLAREVYGRVVQKVGADHAGDRVTSCNPDDLDAKRLQRRDGGRRHFAE